MPAWLISPVGSQQPGAVVGDELVELAAGKALVAQDDQARTQPSALVVQQGGHDLALTQFGAGQHHAIGSPSGAARTYSRNPQK